MSETTPVAAKPARPRPRVDLLTTSLLRRFDDAAKWSRRTGIGMIVIGALLLLSSAIALFTVTEEIALLEFVAALGYGIPGAFLYAYGQRVNRALDEEPAINIELALVHAGRFWVALTACFVIFFLAQVFTVVVPGFRNALRFSRMKSTARSMVPVRDALELYAARNHAYPNAKSYADLLRALQPAYGKDLPKSDAWGTEFQYEASCQGKYCMAYSLRSAGEDRRFSTGNSSRTLLTPLSSGDSDIIIVDGRFTCAPGEWIDK